jgi:hypothetical protein
MLFISGVLPPKVALAYRREYYFPETSDKAVGGTFGF